MSGLLIEAHKLWEDALEISIKEALQAGISAHQSSNFDRAKYYYTTILNADPNHPDANHNMGILFITLGEADEAIRLLKQAITLNPKVEQFWISYISALIKFKKYDAAKFAYFRSLQHGFSASGFKTIKEKLSIDIFDTDTVNIQSRINVQNLIKEKSLEEALRLAKQVSKTGDLLDAKQAYLSILEAFPASNRAKVGLKNVNKRLNTKPLDQVDPPMDQLTALLDNYKNKEYRKVLSGVSTLITKYPRSASLYSIQGAAYISLKDLPNAEAAYREAISLKPDFLEAHNSLGVVFKDQGNYPEALESIYRAISFKPSYAEAFNNLGNTFKAMGRLDEALSAYEDAILISPDMLNAYLNKCIVQKELNDIDGALLTLKKLITLQPKFSKAHFLLGQCHLLKKQYQDAISSFKIAVQIKPDDFKAWNDLGVALNETGQLSEAALSYQKVLEINPKAPEALNNIANIYRKLNRLDDAAKYYKLAYQEFPNSIDLLNNLASVLTDMGSWDEAKWAFKKCLLINPNHSKTHAGLGNLYHECGDITKALNSYNDAIRFDPKNSSAFNNLANVYLENGDVTDAFTAYQAAMLAKPESTTILENVLILIIQLEESAQTMEAKKILMQIVNKFNVSPKLFILLAIDSFINNLTSKSYHFLECYNSIISTTVHTLSPTDKQFCNAYYIFLKALITNRESRTNDNQDILDIVHHFGESHCLSYSNEVLELHGASHRVKPSITFGCKAYHLANEFNNKYKSIINLKFVSLPQRSNLLVSFGEIDCRSNEGFIRASEKQNVPARHLIRKTVTNYVNWFNDLNVQMQHNLHFFNVPAPKYDRRISETLNNKVSSVVSEFNTCLKETVEECGHKLLDVYSLTVSEDGFSNDAYHVDNFHLGPDIIAHLQKQH